MKTSEVLDRAADLIEERGWARPGDWSSTLCASNAIVRASGETYAPAHDALVLYLGGDGHVHGIFAWNDAPGRTAAEVIEVLRACAVIEAAKEQEAAPVEVSA